MQKTHLKYNKLWFYCVDSIYVSFKLPIEITNLACIPTCGLIFNFDKLTELSH